MIDITTLHAPAWKTLQDRRAYLPHALLLTGAAGIGKLELAWRFAASLLCEAKPTNGQICGHCPACTWLAQGFHPDLRLLQPTSSDADGADETKKKSSRQITIDLIRSLDDFVHIGAHRQGLRIILIYPAETMNRNAANALLKMLEEPPPGVLFLLISSEPARLLPTVRSRCQTIPIAIPPADLACAWLTAQNVSHPGKWLALSGGTPVAAMQLAQAQSGSLAIILAKILAAGAKIEPIAKAAELEKAIRNSDENSDKMEQTSLRYLVEWFQKWGTDLTMVTVQQSPRYFIEQYEELRQIARDTNYHKLFGFYRELAEKKVYSGQPLNVRLFLEDLLLSYQRLFDAA